MNNLRVSEWQGRRFWGRVLVTVFALVLLLAPTVALAARSGGSFGGRTGFRSSGGGSASRSTGTSPSRYGGGGGTSFFFFPSFGWGWGGGYGAGGGFGFGSILVLAAVGLTAYSVVRAVRRHRQGTSGWGWGGGDADDQPITQLDRAYVYRLQVALGRSARGIQDRLSRFASEGDTGSEAGLASLLHQTALEVIREKDAIRYAGSDGSGPMSLTNAETRMNGLALSERSRFQVERVRGADGKVRRAEAAPEEGTHALELVVVTLVVATRSPLTGWKNVSERSELEGLLAQLGGMSQDGLLGLEVIWTPADPQDSMTETDVMTTYPELRSV